MSLKKLIDDCQKKGAKIECIRSVNTSPGPGNAPGSNLQETKDFAELIVGNY